MLEFLAIARRNLSGMNIGGEFLDATIRLLDLGAQLRVRRQRSISQPVMADHAVLVWVCDCPRLQLAHRFKSFIDSGLHFCEEIIRKIHAADIDREMEIVVAQKIALETLPKR